MKNKWLELKKRFHKYMCSLEDRGTNDPIFYVYLLFELMRVSILVYIIYYFYKFLKDFYLWVVLR